MDREPGIPDYKEKIMPLPDFILAGETKCGTTSMYNNLIQHHKIFPTFGNGDEIITNDGEQLSVKELRFFDRYYHKGWDWYQSRFPVAGAGCITGEATPMYLYRTQAMQRMASILPDCKIIVMFRNPVKRLVSHYGHIYNLSESYRALYPTFSTFWNTAHESDYYIIDKGIYWQTLQRLYNYYPPKQVKVIISEELFAKPQVVYYDTLKFLGLEYEPFEPAHSRENKKPNPVTDVGLLREVGAFYRSHNSKLEEMLERDLPWE